MSELQIIAMARLMMLVVIMMLAGCMKSLDPRSDANNPYAPAVPQVVNLPRDDNGAIYQPGMRVGLFNDTTAQYVGDVLTIEMMENTNASSTSNTNSSKDNNIDLQSPTLAGNVVTKDGAEILKNEVKGEREFSGQGTSAMSSTFNGKISVTVAQVLPNGNLVVRGEKLMLLNQSEEFIRFTGIVRPQDVKPDNSVPSVKVANVHVAYSGQGALSEANQMGSLGRFFQSPAWPY